MRRAGVTVALAGALAAMLAGCGGGGRLSHSDFVRRADAVCSAYQAKIDLLTQPASYDDVIAYVEKTLPLYVAALDELRALDAPAADEAGVKTWLAANRKVEAAVRSLRDAAMRHDPAATNDASAAIQAASLASRRAAATLGLKVCSTP
ncbi:MAG TPA: hypothetical protein VNH40_09880 [Gaiellaceae bacterium]|nr:hypothetical protein [Gaiellaceae bacterium]